MSRFVSAWLASSFCFAAAAAEGEEWLRLAPDAETIVVQKRVDLRSDGALEALQRSNPRHFGQVRRVLVRMREAPTAGPEHWFPKHVQAKDLEFSELWMQPAFPPRRLMRFTLDDVRYTVEVPLIPPTPWNKRSTH
jgi:hypothetical protein